MDTRPGNERTAAPRGRTRTAVTVAALVILLAFATDTATPASARATDSTMVANDVPSADIVTSGPAAKTTVLSRIKSVMTRWYGCVLRGHRKAKPRTFQIDELSSASRALPFRS